MCHSDTPLKYVRVTHWDITGMIVLVFSEAIVKNIPSSYGMHTYLYMCLPDINLKS